MLEKDKEGDKRWEEESRGDQKRADNIRLRIKVLGLLH